MTAPPGTDYVDPVFPLPSPNFLFVHQVLVGAQDAVITASDGTWTRDPVVDTPVWGYLTSPNPQEVQRATGRNAVIDAVFLCAHDTPVRHQDRIDSTTALEGTPIPTVLRGKYKIEAVRPNPSHVRVLLNRVEADPEPGP